MKITYFNRFVPFAKNVLDISLNHCIIALGGDDCEFEKDKKLDGKSEGE